MFSTCDRIKMVVVIKLVARGEHQDMRLANLIQSKHMATYVTLSALIWILNKGEREEDQYLMSIFSMPLNSLYKITFLWNAGHFTLDPLTKVNTVIFFTARNKVIILCVTDTSL